MTQHSLPVALVQHACSSSHEENLQRSINGIRQAAKQGARLVLLQELHTSLYFCQTENTRHFDLAEPRCLLDCASCPCTPDDQTAQQQYPRVARLPRH